MLSKALQAAAGNGISTVAVAEAIDFDGTNDYLSRSSDLVGNADGKTFTFSAWVWTDTNDATDYILSNWDGANGDFYVFILNTGAVSFVARDTSNTIILQGTSSVALPLRTWSNLQISIDLASASNRYVAINDVIDSSVTWSTYSNQTIDFTASSWYISQTGTGGSRFEGRLSNVYLDYTYRDLSVEANRRLFVTADLKPAAGQAALNPILYLPMDDPTQPGLNAGTGGDFTLTGVVARSGRGPNQYNAPYSDLDGTADFLSRASLTGVTDGKQLTVSFVFNADDLSSGDFVFSINQSSSFLLYITTRASAGNGNGLIEIYAKNTSAATGLQASTQLTSVSANRNYHVVMSFDLTDTNKRHIAVNGQLQALNVQSYVDVNLDLTGNLYNVASGWSTTTRMDGRLGALWFNTSYIDLSVAANLAKFVTGTGIDAKPVDLGANGELPTGTSPLIYLPMYGNNAGKNYGTGGDFTVNSGPYTGARGPNEFWGNKMRTTVSSYVGRTSAMTGVTSGKKFSCSFFVSQGQAAGGRVLSLVGNTGDSTEYLMIDIDVDGNFSIYGYNSSQVNILALPNMPFGGTATLANVYHVLIAVDLSTASYRIYVNGVNKSPSGGIVLTNDNIKFDGGRPSVGAGPVAIGNAGDKSEFYFTTDYIDFSQEANRLKFRDAFGNPVDLTKQIEDGAIPNPAIYMRFDPASFGTNSGTGGDFAVNGAITDGGQL